MTTQEKKEGQITMNNITINGREFTEDQYAVFNNYQNANTWANYNDEEGVTADMTDMCIDQEDIKSGMTVYVLDIETSNIEEIEVTE